MLTYIIQVTSDLLAVSLVLGVTYAFIDWYCSEKGQMILRAGTVLGFIAAGIRAYITNTRRLKGGWRVGMYGYGAGLAVWLVLMICILITAGHFFRIKQYREKDGAAHILVSALTAVLVITQCYNTLFNVYVYPFKFDTGGNGILSTDYLFRLGGYLLGILVTVISAIAACRIMSLAAKKGMTRLLAAVFFILQALFAVNCFGRLMLVLTPRKIVNSQLLFRFGAACNNYGHLFAWAGFAVVGAVGIILWIKSRTMQEPYANKAEHRKLRAAWRNGKRWTAVLGICFVIGILSATWFVKLNTVVIREAPVEEPQLIKDGSGNDSELRVPIEMVSDGHLHRFGYTTAEGNPVRFIVVLKQENTMNYGVGLDACEICGEAGYYENNEGQVVCKKCNVVMNRMTIGMKGGCNPIIIDYDINENYITVPVSEMVNNESRFKK